MTLHSLDMCKKEHFLTKKHLCYFSNKEKNLNMTGTALMLKYSGHQEIGNHL